MSAIYSSALLGSQVNLIQTAPCRASFRPNSKSVLCSRRKLVCKAEESAPEAPTEAGQFTKHFSYLNNQRPPRPYLSLWQEEKMPAIPNV